MGTYSKTETKKGNTTTYTNKKEKVPHVDHGHDMLYYEKVQKEKYTPAAVKKRVEARKAAKKKKTRKK